MSERNDAVVVSPFIWVGEDAPVNVRPHSRSDDPDALTAEIGEMRTVKLNMSHATAVRLYGALGSALKDADAARAEREGVTAAPCAEMGEATT